MLLCFHVMMTAIFQLFLSQFFANPRRDSSHSDCDCHFCERCVSPLCKCGRLWPISVIRKLQIRQHSIWPPAFFIIQKTGKTCLLKEMGEWQRKLLSDLKRLFSLSCVSVSTSDGLSWMEDKIFRQQESKRHIWNNCPVCINMAEKDPVAFRMLQLESLPSVSQSICLSRCSVFLSGRLNFYCKHC